MYVGKPVSLDLDLNVTLICMKARKVPFALREKTDAELDKLVEQGVLEPMNHPTQRKSLAKLDLAQAYQQLTVDDATADAQTIITHRGAFRVKRFKIDATGIHPAKAKVQAIQDAPTPKNKQQLQAFLGLLNFYHSFLKDKATVAEQLHRLLDKNARWIWTSKHEKAFRDVKRLLSSDAVLTHYDGKKPMRCIATWFGAVLCHKLSSTQEIPITFYSRTLSTMERNYGQIDKEALAVIAGVKKFHEYLYGRQFTIITDHKPLFGLFVPKKETPQILSPRMLRWSILLNAYDYTINYRPGKEIANADALSRLPKQSTENNDSHNPVILSLETIDNSPLHSKDITRITAKDPILTRVLSWAWRSWPKSVSDERLKPYVTRQHELSIHNGCLLWGSRVIIPLQARHKIFKELHIGHPGIVRMKALSRSYVWWPKLDSEIENLVRTWELCQQSRASPPHAPVHKWESPRIPWSRIHVELAGPIYGKNFLIVVDAFSKWLEVRVLKNTTSESVISCLRQIFSIHGLPDIIVSDNGTQFTSHIFQEYLNKGGIKHITSASFHPSSNGQAERMVRITKEFLKKMTQRDWEYDLANFSFCQHVTPCTTAGKSPAELLMNRRLRTVLDRLQPDVELEDLDKNFEKVRTFQTDDQVYARNYSSEKTWKPATFVTQTGPPSYQVQTEDGQLWPRHIDQRKSNHRKIKLEKKTVEAIPEEDTAVVTTPREESAAASPSPDIESVGQQRSSTRKRRPPERLRDYEC
ncbi:putative integrase core domain protein [Trichinella spiralis]|uniref:putative integrase core domain protein n=1 Tax=Trichinella spiralis TaxID=6334 RepID=UPI0001EFC894|nr:putative integrase core domain protein [Trichinella spiralis]